MSAGRSSIATRVSEIRKDDVAVFNNGTYHHVAMVTGILQYWSGEAWIQLSESRNARYGGPQTNDWRVRQQTVARGRHAGDPIEDKFDIVGRGGDNFVKFVSPDRFKE